MYQYGEISGYPVIVMPFLKGRPLSDLIVRGAPLPLGAVLRIGAEVADALEGVHAAGVVHRDVKPDNLFLCGAARRLALLDFSAAAPDGARGPAWEQLTEPGGLIGTPAFMSPEMVQGRAVDCRADLFGLGAVLYLITTGRSPFACGSLYATIAAIAVVCPPDPIEVNAAVPQGLSSLIMRLLAKRPGERPGSSSLVGATLRQLAAQHTV
jgi:serine/threonine protein kinase